MRSELTDRGKHGSSRRAMVRVNSLLADVTRGSQGSFISCGRTFLS
jgi:hypothetical protein